MSSLPKWMAEKNNLREQNRRSARQERGRAKEIGGRTRAGSGSSWRAPQDVVSPEYLEQMKYTDAASFRVTVRDLRHLADDALRAGKEARMVVDFMQHGLRMIITTEPLPKSPVRDDG